MQNKHTKCNGETIANGVGSPVVHDNMIPGIFYILCSNKVF